MQAGTLFMCLLRVSLIQPFWIGALRAQAVQNIPIVAGESSRQRSDTLRLSLEGVRDLARRLNPDVVASRWDTTIATGNERQAGLSPFNPTIDALSSSSATGPEYSAALEIEVFGKRSPRRAAAHDGVVRAKAASLDTERRVLAEAERAFYRLVAATRRAEVATEVLLLDERLADAVSRQLAAGEVNRITYNLAIIALGRSRSDKLAAQRDERLAQLRLVQLLGLRSPVTIQPQVDEPLVVGDSAAVEQAAASADTFNVAALIAGAMSRRPDIAQVAANVRQAEAIVTSSRRAALPNLIVRVTSEEIAPGQRAVRPGVGVALPLLNRNQGELAARQAALHQALDGSRAVASRVAIEVEGAVADYVAAASEVSTLRIMVLRAGRQNRELSETAYREGKIGLPEILLIRNQAVSAELGYWAAWLAEREALATLAEVTGQNISPRTSGGPQ